MKLIKRTNLDVSKESFNNIKLEVEEGLGFELSDFLLKLVIGRGFSSPEEIIDYLSPNDKGDPFMFKDMRKAVDRISKAIDNNEKIVVWGDFDVDGVTSTTILTEGLRSVGADVNFYIPVRNLEPYGLNKDGLKKVSDFGTSLLITVDCGIAANEEVDYANELGMDVIVTDHHQVSSKGLPNSYALINPHAPDETYPFKGLAGVGVAYRLLQGVIGDKAKEYVDYVALGTVVDMMELKGENRAIVKEGLEKMNNNPSRGLALLINEIYNNNNYPDTNAPKKPKVLKASHLSFGIGPVINSVGRLWEAKMITYMFTTDNYENALKIARKAVYTNVERKSVESNVKSEVNMKIEEIIDNEGELPKILVIDGYGWERGVLGLVASSVTNELHRPCIILNYNPEKELYEGSGRSIPGLNLHKTLSNVEFLLGSWGGHKAAAGVSVPEMNYEMFKEVIQGELEFVDEEVFSERVNYDLELPLELVDHELIGNLSLMEPTGLGNPGPKFISTETNLEDLEVVGDGSMFKGRLFREGVNLDFISFDAKEPRINVNNTVVFTVDINDYNNTPQAVVKNIVESIEDLSKVEFNQKVTNLELSDLGITNAKVKQFKGAGLNSSQKLLEELPRRYLDYSKHYSVNELLQRDFKKDKEEDKLDVAIVGYVDNYTVKMLDYGKPRMTLLFCRDLEGNSFTASFFGPNEALINGYNKHSNKPWIFCGKYNATSSGRVYISPKLYSHNVSKYNKLYPVYKIIKGMSEDYKIRTIERAFSELEAKDYITREILEDFGLITYPQMIRRIHFPEDQKELDEAHKRYVFDQLFKYSLSMRLKDYQAIHGNFFTVNKRELSKSIEESLPFDLTGDQAKAIDSIYESMNNPEKSLNALVQGDVGSGKTMVAILSMAIAYENGYQSCLVAPTDILAKQHYAEMYELLKPFGIDVEFLSSDTSPTDRKRILEGLKDGNIKVLVGTHSVFQKTVKYKNLGMVIIDEQHRFGVSQREALLDVERPPHMINMSATPIPRTLSMATLGESVEVFNIKEKPAGRKEVITEFAKSSIDSYDKIVSELRKGHQAYIVCPLVEKSKSTIMEGVKSVEEEVESIKRYLSVRDLDYNVSGISGKIKPEELDEEISKFENKEIDILVSTTVVEVGVNIPNATIIVIKSSERFGLPQLHQLRGRVGRSSYQSYCVLETSDNSPTERVDILTSTNDGFEIASEDLKLRGTGSFLGTEQSGSDKTVDLMIEYPDMYQKISKLTETIYNDRSQTNLYKSLLDL